MKARIKNANMKTKANMKVGTMRSKATNSMAKAYMQGGKGGGSKSR